MSRKLGQIIAVRENTWRFASRWVAILKPNNAAITIARFMGLCARLRSFSERKSMNSEPISSETAQRFGWISTSIKWPEAVDLVFVTEFGRPVNVNSLVYKYFKPILKRAGLPNIRLYDLRHTAATLALTVGISPKVVSEQLGHTSAAFTLDVYSHVLPQMQDDAAAKVESVLRGNGSQAS